MIKKLHELEPTSRFSDRAGDYARFRPDYPAEAIEAIAAGAEIILDVGAGTGISSRQVAEKGARVIALEPNDAMREAAEPHPGVEYLKGTAESIPLPDGSVNLVTAFQAYHWFEPMAALREFHRVLERGGRLAVIWNERDHSDEFTREYGRIIRELSNNHPAERREQSIDSLLASALFREVCHNTYRYEQRLYLDGLIGRARSASYLPSEGQGLVRLIAELTALHQRWRDDQDQVTLVYRTEVYEARRH